MNWETGTFDTSYLSNNYCYFELIEDNTIDIDSIEKLEITDKEREQYVRLVIENADKINELLQAVKQLNKEIKELKEKTSD